MELVFRLIEEIRNQTFEEVSAPPEDKRSAFDYGRVHGMLFGLALLRERLEGEIEAQARAAQQREREFDDAS